MTPSSLAHPSHQQSPSPPPLLHHSLKKSPTLLNLPSTTHPLSSPHHYYPPFFKNFSTPTSINMQSCTSSFTLLLQMESPKLHNKKKKWLLSLLFSLLLSSFLILIFLFSSNGILTPIIFTKPPPTPPKPSFVETLPQLKTSPVSTHPVPRIAYLVSGSSGDGESLKRTLKALYHPFNQYVVHLDLEASLEERLDLVKFVQSEAVFVKFGNVRVISKANLVTYRGPTMVSNTLHAASILLKEGGDWDWFVNLSASDYPLVSQDDLLHTLLPVPRDLNFIEHTSNIGWKEFHRARPVIIDPGLYSLRKSDVFWVPQKRSMPSKFKLFTGSAWMMLSRPFVEFCLWGWDNLPRLVLMYYANFLSSPEGYFHTVICNSPEFRNTTINHDLHFISWDNPPKQHPHFLTENDFQRMVNSNAPFARKFGHNVTVLEKIDSELLGCSSDGFVPGGWFANFENLNISEPDSVNSVELKPGPGAERVRQLFSRLLSDNDAHGKHCT